MNVIVNWSGGPDSTATLQYLLVNSDYKITAFYADGDQSSDLANQMEEKAVDQLYQIMQNRYRNFDLLKVKHLRSQKFAMFKGEQNIYPALMFLDNNSVKMYIGRCWEDKRTNWPPELYRFWERQQQILLASNVELVWFNTETTKREIRKQLGDLWPITFSCSSPDTAGNPCAKCLKCKQRLLATKRRY